MNKSHYTRHAPQVRVSRKTLLISVLMLDFAFGDRLLQSPKSRQNAWQKNSSVKQFFAGQPALGNGYIYF